MPGPKRRKLAGPAETCGLLELPADVWQVVFSLLSDSPVWLYAVWLQVCTKTQDMPRPTSWPALTVGANSPEIPLARWREWREITSVTIYKRLPADRQPILARMIESKTRVHGLVLDWVVEDDELTWAARMPGLQRLGTEEPGLEGDANPFTAVARCDHWLNLDGCGDVSPEALAAYLRNANPRTLFLTNYKPFLPRPQLVASAGACLRQLSLSGCETLRDLSWLAGLAALETLDLSRCTSVTNRALAVLAQLPRLARLGLGRCKLITAEGLAPLSNLASLVYLDLAFLEQLTNVRFLRNLGGLRKLQLYGCGLNNQSLGPLSGLTELKYLSLGANVRLTDAGLRQLPARLEWLSLDYCTGLTGDGFGCLSEWRNLRYLSLRGCTAVTAANLQQLPNTLQKLSLQQCSQLTDADIWRLRHLGELRVLDLSWTDISAAAVKHCVQLPNLEELRLDYCHRLDSNVFRHLTRPSRLKRLGLKYCFGIGRSAITEFMALHPRLQIEMGLRENDFQNSEWWI